MDNLIYWIWLSQACTPDSATFARLLDKFSDAKDVYDATEREIRLTVGKNASDCSALMNKDLTKATEIYDFCKKKNVGIVTYADPTFPESLRSIPTPPVLLYFRGVFPDFNKGIRCAIVGTRSLSEYGRTNAFKLGYDLACAGATIVSGMAIGIDGVALAGALAAGGKTIAVIGSGIDVCYPSSHLKLAREIVKAGCVITEYAPGTKPEKYNFPRRNRLISGLSAATIVVEGRERSGAVITARHARAQGRPVFAFPGHVESEGSQSTNLLLKNGAKICTCAEDIISHFEKDIPCPLNLFKLKIKPDVDMMGVLRELQVSALTPTDDIFIIPKVKTVKKQNTTEQQPKKDTTSEENLLPPMPDFDAELLGLYKKIPANSDCAIESLTDDNYDLRRVMKLLLKLEMGRFVTMLPGERVKRNIK